MFNVFALQVGGQGATSYDVVYMLIDLYVGRLFFKLVSNHWGSPWLMSRLKVLSKSNGFNLYLFTVKT